jgi:hypothetical protein
MARARIALTVARTRLFAEVAAAYPDLAVVNRPQSDLALRAGARVGSEW